MFQQIKNTARQFIYRYSFPLKLLTSISLLVYCASFIDFKQLSQINIHWGWFSIAWILVLLDYFIGALRFKVLSDPMTRIALLAHVRYYFWAGFFNSALPGSIGGDAMRMVWLKNHAVSGKLAVSLVAVERVLGLLTLILIAGIAAMTLDIPHTLVQLLPTLGMLFGGCAMGGLALLFLLRKTRFVTQALMAISETFENVGLVYFSALLSLSILYQVVTIAITICVAIGIGLDLDFKIWFFVVPLVWLLTIAPISVGGLGVREVGFVFLLSAFGQFNEQAVVLGLLTFVVHLLGGLIGGAWYVVYGEKARQ